MSKRKKEKEQEQQQIDLSDLITKTAERLLDELRPSMVKK